MCMGGILTAEGQEKEVGCGKAMGGGEAGTDVCSLWSLVQSSPTPSLFYPCPDTSGLG